MLRRSCGGVCFAQQKIGAALNVSRRDVPPELAASRLRLLLTWQTDNI